MRWLRQLYVIEPVKTAGVSAATYVPWVMVSRGLAFLRTLVVARLLGKAGQGAFGLYQPALEVINPLVALVMFGAADVAERYVSRVERERGAAGVRRWIAGQWGRIGVTGLAVGVLMGVSGWVSPFIWGSRQAGLLAMCGAAVLALAMYQYLAATLRGLRAYGAAAGMEVTSAVLLLVLSAGAAEMNSAVWLVGAYVVSVLVPLLGYGIGLGRHLQKGEAGPEGEASNKGAGQTPALRRAHAWFAWWTMVRLMLVLVFGFLSVWGLKALIDTADGARHTGHYVPEMTAQYAMPWRIAQLLGFVAVTAWASSYGIAARAWSQGQVRRAKAQYFRMGRLTMGGLTVIAVGLMMGRGAFGWVLPTYGAAIGAYLPRMLGVFLGYGLLTFVSGYGDLAEKPWKGALLWVIAVGIVGAGIGLGNGLAPGFLVWGEAGGAAAQAADLLLAWSALGLGVALLVALPLVCRPVTGRAGRATGLLGLAAVTLFVPVHGEWVAGALLVGALALLYWGGMLVRPNDRRAWRRWRLRAAESTG